MSETPESWPLRIIVLVSEEFKCGFAMVAVRSAVRLRVFFYIAEFRREVRGRDNITNKLVWYLTGNFWSYTRKTGTKCKMVH